MSSSTENITIQQSILHLSNRIDTIYKEQHRCKPVRILFIDSNKSHISKTIPALQEIATRRWISPPANRAIFKQTARAGVEMTVFVKPEFKNHHIYRQLYFEEIENILTAIEREKHIKYWNRRKKLEIVMNTNPTHIQLCEGWFDNEQEN